jgi:uncharacterized protein
MMDIIKNVKQYAQNKLKNTESGHDFWHAIRVLNNANYLSKNYTYANTQNIQISALLHDIIDHKFVQDKNKEINEIKNLLRKLQINKKDIDKILCLMQNISFSSETKNIHKSIELKILQDADRLDAIGAIGIARAFSYGGYKKRELYNPSIKPKLNMNKQKYINSKSSTINHFYEKLLKLKDMMNTPEAKIIAQKRHNFMLLFLDEFFKEWNN